MVYVVDAPMGVGKTSACINYMRSHPEYRYIYVTPFINETERIQRACPDLDFATPDNLYQYRFAKHNHLAKLIEERRNVSITHSLFKMVDNDMCKIIAEQNYVVFIDEVLDVFSPYSISTGDYDLLVNGGEKTGLVVRDESNEDYEVITAAEKAYTYSGKFDEVISMAKSYKLVQYKECRKGRFYFWIVNKNLFETSTKIFVLTYMFDGTPMKAFLDINGFGYETIGAGKDDDGQFRFMTRTKLPEHFKTLGDKIHICESESLNKIGEAKGALSATWSKNAATHRDNGLADKVRKNLNNYFKHYCGENATADKRLWSTFKSISGIVRDKGFYRSDLSWNSRATNSYADKKYLAYCVNVFENPFLQKYVKYFGAEINNDKYATGCMVQWIFRSAIRNGEEIWLYIPSKRMRKLLYKWIEDMKNADYEGGEVIDV